MEALLPTTIDQVLKRDVTDESYTLSSSYLYLYSLYQIISYGLFRMPFQSVIESEGAFKYSQKVHLGSEDVRTSFRP